MRTLVTGVTGFVGSHLAELLVEEGQEVVGLSRRSVWPPGTEQLAARVRHVAIDCADVGAMRNLLATLRPACIYHLAGQANVPASVRDPQATWQANYEGSRGLFEAVLEACPQVRVLLVSTGTVYGEPAPGDPPISEQSPTRPPNPYAQSKKAAEVLALGLWAQHSLRALIARPFNHIGPRQQSKFAVAHFAQQIALAEAGQGPGRMRVGNLDAQRDFTDVRDVVRAYRALMDSAADGAIFNVASGTSWRVGSLLEQLLAMSRVPLSLEQDEVLLRELDPTCIAVDRGALTRATHWEPRIPIDQTLRDTLEYWRWRVGGPSGTP